MQRRSESTTAQALAPQLGGGPKYGTQGTALAGDAVVGGDDLVHGTERVGSEQRPVVRDRDALNHLERAVLRATVGVDDDRALIGEEARKPPLNRPDHVTDGPGVVEAGYTHQDVYLADLCELLAKPLGKERVVRHPTTPAPRKKFAGTPTLADVSGTVKQRWSILEGPGCTVEARP
jgi:hypothetical protein